MKVAVLADIHGNDIALRAVLHQARESEVDQLIILGDLVGYYYRSKAVLGLLQDWKKEIIQGNHERMLKKCITDSVYARNYKEKYGSSLMIALSELSEEDISCLTQLSKTKSIEIGQVILDLHHGSPWDEDEYIYPNSKESDMIRAVESKADFVLIGHSHYQFSFSKNKNNLVNPGSVGQSRSIGGLACWAIIDTEDKSFRLMQTKYNVDNLISETKKTDPKVPYLWEVLKRNT